MKKGYNQCCIKRSLKGTLVYQTAYIPEKFAVVGEHIKIKGEDGIWIDGWEVLSVGAYAEKPPDWRKAIRGHKGRTGDSLPKPESK